MLSAFLGGIDMGIVGPAFTTITREMAINPKSTAWIIIIYSIFYVAAIPVLSKLTDTIGRKKILVFSLFTFGLGSIIAGFAPEIYTLILGRSIQAIGAAGFLPLLSTLVADNYPEEKRGAMLGIVGAFIGLANVIGPALGGAFVSYLSWRWIFYINIPIIVAILFVVARFVDTYIPTRKKIDYIGALALFIAITAGMLSITYFNPAKIYMFISTIAITVLAIVVFVINTVKTSAEPAIDFRLLSNKQILITSLLGIVSGYGMTALFFLPAFSEMIWHQSVFISSILVTVVAVAIFVTTPLSGRMVDRMPAKTVLLIGTIVSLIGLIIVAYAPLFPIFILGLVILGAGLGFTMGSTLNYIIFQNVNPEHRGTGIGVLSFFRTGGIIVGATVAAKLMQSATSSISPDALKLVYLVFIIVTAISLIFVFGLKKIAPIGGRSGH